MEHQKSRRVHHYVIFCLAGKINVRKIKPSLQVATKEGKSKTGAAILETERRK